MQRELKYGSWIFDEDESTLTIKVYHPKVEDGKYQEITIPKTYIFSIQRFMTSVFQRMSVKRRKKKDKIEQIVKANIENKSGEV